MQPADDRSENDRVRRRCVGHMEREPGRLQLRYVLRGDDEMYVYLDRPLGDRTVVDGVGGQPVPYVNVYAQLSHDEAGANGRDH
jgi:hypothetical protein